MAHVRQLAPEPFRNGLLAAPFDDIVQPEDDAIARAHVGIVGSAPGGALLLWGPELACLAHNHRFRTVSGLRPATIGRPLFSQYPELEPIWRPKLDQALAGVPATLDEPFFVGRNESNAVGWILPVVGSDGGAVGILVLVVDVSGSTERLSRLIGMAAHDLRDPVLGIRLLAQRLSRAVRVSRERCEEEMGRITSMAEHMERLIGDLSAFSRLANGIRLEPRPGDLGSLVRAACDELRVDVPFDAGLDAEQATGDAPSTVRPPPVGELRRAEKRLSDLTMSGPLEVTTQEVFGLWDGDAIRRIVVNLVTNARKHGPEGAKVLVSVALVKDWGVISVTDQGPGIAEHDVDQLFEPWRRGRADPGARPGAGLGLFIVRELVTAQGGKISCERARPSGFTMRVSLPIPGSGVFRAPERPR
jgi:signal transduction histidine kinase